MVKEEITTKVQIVKKSIELIKEKGFSNVSVSEICKALGITRSAFYYYFKTKDEIFDYYLLQPENYIIENILPIVDTGSYREQFFRIFQIFSARIEEVGPEIIRFIFKRNIDTHVENLAPRDIAMWRVYVNLVRKAQEAGEISNTADAETIVEAIMHLANGIGITWCNKNASFDYAVECQRFINFIFDNGSQTYNS